jgi:hypothetical protein
MLRGSRELWTMLTQLQREKASVTKSADRKDVGICHPSE